MGGNGDPALNENEEGLEQDVVYPESVDTNVENLQNVPSNYNNSFSTGSRSGPAKEERRGRQLYLKVVKHEQRSKYLKGLGLQWYHWVLISSSTDKSAKFQCVSTISRT